MNQSNPIHSIESDDKMIFIPDFNSSAYSTNFFTHSWILTSELDQENFNRKLDILHAKDLERDPDARKMEYILIHSVFNRVSYIVSIKNFMDLTLDVRLNLFKTFDFYIPRSIWFKSFAMLNKDKLKFLEEWCK